MQLFEVNRTTVWRALNYRGESALYPKVRSAAIEMGGQMVGVPELKTTFFETAMVQTYGGRLNITTNFATGYTYVNIDGVLVDEQRDLRIDEYTRLQQRYIRKVNVQ